MVAVRDLSGNGVSPAVGDRPTQSADSSSGNFFAVVVGTPWDGYCRALYVGVGGTVNVVNEQGTTVAFLNVPNGTWLDVRTKSVPSVTSAASIVRIM